MLKWVKFLGLSKKCCVYLLLHVYIKPDGILILGRFWIMSFSLHTMIYFLDLTYKDVKERDRQTVE